MTDVVFLGANAVGDRVYDWLTDREDTNVLAMLTEADQLSVIEQLEPAFIVSAGFRHVVPGDVLEVPKRGAINCHLSYLPFNRGMNPNVWGIIEDHPAGVSIHYMTPAVDAGPIIDRREVEVRPDDTGRTLYDRLCDAQVAQFKEIWPALLEEEIELTDQDPDEGTYHHQRDFTDLWEIDREEEVRAGDFLDRLRALTFPPFDNAYFEVDGTRYHVDISIRSEDDTEDDYPEGRIPAYEE